MALTDRELSQAGWLELPLRLPLFHSSTREQKGAVVLGRLREEKNNLFMRMNPKTSPHAKAAISPQVVLKQLQQVMPD